MTSSRWPHLACLGLLSLILGVSLVATPVSAQIHPPKQGFEFPDGYREMMANDKEGSLFRFKRAWFAETERVRKNRERLRRPDGLLDASAALSQIAVTGTRRVPILAGKFSDTGSDPYSIAQLQNQLFDGPNPTGTMTDYYDEISYGNITLEGTVFGNGAALFQTSQTGAYYAGNNNGLPGATSTAQTGQYMKEILDGTDSGIDFGLYDNDGPDGLPNSGDDDGFVDFVAFVHPRFGGECGGGIWSHRWVWEGWFGSPYTTDDAANGGGFIRISDYTIQPLLSCNTSSIIEIGVYAHEFGHAFGLPDLYDTDTNNGTSEGVGEWCLMASGSYGGDGNHPARPSHMSAWCKEQLGWVNPTVVCQDMTDVYLAAAADSADVLRVYPHGVLDNEYFLIENRVKTGFDQYLHNSGIAVWHVDNDNPGNGDENNKLVDLEEADGLAQLDASANRGDGGDVYPGASFNYFFNATSNPNSDDNAGAATGFALTNFNLAAFNRKFDIAVAPCQIAVKDVALDDSPCGNNNGVLDGNEAANLRVGLAMELASAISGVSATLTSLTPGVSVVQGSASYGTVGGATTFGSPDFVVEATGPLADGTLVQFQIDLTDGGSFSQSNTIEIYAGAFVLLVEDDGTAVYNTSYEAAITAAGRNWVRHNFATDGVPPLGLLESARAVVWYTGREFDNTLSPSEQDVLAAFLDNGGSLFLSGQDLGYDLSSQGNAADQTFYSSYLHATFLADDTNDNTVTGIGGDPIGNGLSLTLTSALNDYPSRISGGAGTSSVFQYSAGNIGAIRYSTGHNLVYFAFNYEAINSSASRATVMQRVLDWFGPSDVTSPTAMLLTPADGDTVSACSPVSVTWSASDNVGVNEIDLAYATDGFTWIPIATGLSNSGSYDWDASTLVGSTVTLKVIARDAVGLQGVDTAQITLVALGAAEVTATYPNGGEVFSCGSTVNTDWSPALECASFDSSVVFVSLDGGSSYDPVATVAAPDTNYLWTAPVGDYPSVLWAVDVYSGGSIAASDTSDGQFAVTSVDQVTASYPNGGEVFSCGSTVNTDWSPALECASFDSSVVFVSLDGGSSYDPVATVAAPDTNYLWTAPVGDYPSVFWAVDVYSGGVIAASDTSDGSFNVTSFNEVAVTYPNGGETFGCNANVFTDWSPALECASFDSSVVSISLDGGSTYNPVATVAAPDTNFLWVTPATAVAAAKLQVEIYSGGSVAAYDTSDSNFQIADLSPPTVAFTTPDDGDTLGTGNGASIDWLADDDKGVDTIDLEFSWDGVVWSTLAAGLANTPPFAWTAPDSAEGPAFLRITAADAGSNAASDTLGLLVLDDDAPTVTLLQPNGGESGEAGSSMAVDASMADNVGIASICIRYSLDAGASWSDVDCGGTPTLPYAWTLPDTSSDSCLVSIAVYDGQGYAAADTSDSLFAIVQTTTAVPAQLTGVTRPVLLQNYPNPMRRSATTFAFYLPEEDLVRLRVFDISGRLVKTLADGPTPGGYHERVWNATDQRGRSVSEGIYFYVLETAGRREMRKLVLLR